MRLPSGVSLEAGGDYSVFAGANDLSYGEVFVGGANENFNGLLRQYLPKGTCMSTVTQARCNQIADDLNHRPRKRHGFKTPAALYHRN